VPRKEDVADTEKRSLAFAQLAAMKMAGPEGGKIVDIIMPLTLIR